MSTPVTVAVLGPVRAWVDGVPADLGVRRQRAVLARLAVAGGEVVPVDTLVDDLWHGEPPPRALAALQAHVSHLRRALEPGRPPRAPATVLVSSAPGYALHLAPDALDSRRLTGLVERAAGADPATAAAVLGTAQDLWSGRAYGEFADEPWAAAEVGRLGELRLVVAERRAQARLACGDADVVVPELDALVRAHPLREEVVRLLAVALYRAGRQADALAVLATARRRLADELGVDPGPALRDLERDVLAHAVPRPSPPPSPPGPARPAPARSTLPEQLLGRAAERARLRAVADRVAAGDPPPGQLVLVAAEAGGGKTTFAEAVRSDLAAAGWTAGVGRCPEVDGAPPGWPWRELVDAVAAEHPPAPELEDRLAALRGHAAPTGAFWTGRAVADLLASTGRPVLLVLDDLHRADAETLQLLRAVVGGALAPTLVVATLRPEETGPDVGSALAALAGAVADRITLPGLAGSDVAALLARHGAGEIGAVDARLVADRTAGNPLFVREIARLVASDGPGAVAAVPEGVRDVLRRRVARLPAAARTVLQHAAVLGRDVDVDVVLRLVPDAGQALDGLELGVVSGLLTEPAPHRLRFAHDLVRDTLYVDVPGLRRARLHAAAFGALAPQADAVELGRHALAAGPALAAEPALDALTAAARATGAAGAHGDAARLWAAALDRSADAGLAVEDEVDLRCAHVSALAHAGDAAGAMAARAVALARAAGTDRVGAALTAVDAPASWSLRDVARVDDAVVALLERELARTRDPARRVRLLVTTVLETESGDQPRALAAGEEALALSRGLDPVLRCAALNARGFVVNGPDLRHEMEAVGRELLATAESAGLAGYRTVGHHLLFMVATGRLDLDAAQRHADAAVAIAPGAQLGFTLTWSRIFGALRALIAGDFERAEAEYATVARWLDAVGGVNGWAMGFFALAAVRHAQGRLGELAGMLADAPPDDSVAELRTAVLLAAGRRAEAAAAWRPGVEPVRTYFWWYFAALRAENAIALGHREVAAALHADLLPWSGTLAGVGSGSATFGPVGHVLADLGAFLGRPAAEVAEHRAAARDVARRLGAAHWERPGA